MDCKNRNQCNDTSSAVTPLTLKYCSDCCIEMKLGPRYKSNLFLKVANSAQRCSLERKKSKNIERRAFSFFFYFFLLLEMILLMYVCISLCRQLSQLPSKMLSTRVRARHASEKLLHFKLCRPNT